ncbi:MAG: outer membrane lipoprotein chaperone LolA [Gemmatimonadaceae bacterium]|nr:outer membrane lipoprotein chaperone LolA [Gemmatimonadaceae bacterium]
MTGSHSISRWLATAALGAASLGAWARVLPAQDAAGAAIDRAVEAYAKVKTARASFEQVVTNPLTGSRLQSRGEFEQARPDRFAFRFADPKGDMIVSDGKYVWVYLPSSTPGQVIRAPLTSDVEGSIDLIGAFFSNPRARYTVSDGGAATLGGRASRIVTLTPKGKASSSFTRAKVWIDAADGTLRQFEAEELNGVVRLVKITAFDANAAVAEGAFRFKPPRGVRVVDQSEIQ